jgi:3-hydroxymyristoyl/3-hydroxydecanoyl-(acyl carrier protein) dehydratase
MSKNRDFFLRFGIDHRVEDGIASIESDLPETLPVFNDLFENRGVHGIVEGSEQWLLSLPRV